jgi:hypothetical protein
MARSVLKIILSNIAGFLFFLILLAIANILLKYIPSAIYADVVNFFNTNIFLFLVMMLIGMINDIFWSFYFPFNILAPISSALLSLFIVVFFYTVWNFLNIYIKADVAVPKGMYTPVALLVLVVGYILILVRRGRPREVYEKWAEKKEEVKKKSESARKRPEQDIDWEDVGNEFKLFFYNLAKSMNKGFEKEKQKEKRKKK